MPTSSRVDIVGDQWLGVPHSHTQRRGTPLTPAINAISKVSDWDFSGHRCPAECILVFANVRYGLIGYLLGWIYSRGEHTDIQQGCL